MKFALVLVCLLVLATFTAHADDSFWSPEFSAFGVGWQNTAGTVNTVVYRNGDIYIGGLFDRVGTVPANNVARYDGRRWHALDEGVNGEVYELVSGGGAIWACGGFSEAGGNPASGVARWHSDFWWDLDVAEGGPNGQVYCLEYENSILYAGGDFTEIGGVVTGRVAGWDGHEWSAVSSNDLRWQGYSLGTVHTLEFFGAELWAGGDFDYAHPWTCRHLAVLFEGRWTPPGDGGGLDGRVSRLRSGGDTLWILGEFGAVEGEPSPQLASARLGHVLHTWDGSLPGGSVRDLVPDENSFALATHQVARYWNIEGWHSPYDTLANIMVLDEIMYEMVAGGHFVGLGGWGDAVVRWDGDGWRHIGGGLARSLEAPDHVNVFTSWDGDLIAGGYFDIESVSPEVPHCYNVGRYDGRHWLPLGHGFVDEVNALAVYQGQLYAGGDFDNSGPVTVGRLAVWDGAAWQPVGGGSGIDGYVNALVVHDGRLVIGGSFDNAGDLACEDLVTWDGASFAHLGSGNLEGSTIRALAVHDGDLYTAGSFTAMDGVAAYRIARWDGADWHALGEGLDPTARCMISHDGDLWVGVSQYAPGESVPVLWRWDGEQWHEAVEAVGHENVTEVASLLSGSAGLVAGGTFDTIDNVNVANVAVLGGSTWEPFGSGVSGGYQRTLVSALHVHDDLLHLGGDFTEAGYYPSASIARWNETMTPVFLQRFTAVEATDDLGPAVRLRWLAAVTGEPAEFRLTAARSGMPVRPVAGGPDGDGSWSAVDRAADLARGGEVVYTLEARQGDEPWREVGRETVALTASAAWLRPQLAVAPNPANPRTTVSLWLPRAGRATVTVYDVRGRQVARLLDGEQAAGRASVTWDGCDGHGREAASGTYLVQVRCEVGVVTERVAVVR